MYSCKILLDSINRSNDRLTTFEITIPRFILAEFNTHRMLSRNSASSRAIPVEKILKRIESDPFIPEYWGKNQKGMQAHESLSEEDSSAARKNWIDARNNALESARQLLKNGVHKQLANRILEPFLWQTIIASATEWQNFFGLRGHPDAQPEFKRIALMMKEAYDSSSPSLIEDGEWHLPLIGIDEEDLAACHEVANSYQDSDRMLAFISAGRCARVSYLTHDGKRNPREDIKLASRLLEDGHMSPLEHVACADSSMKKYVGNFKGFLQFRKTIPYEDIFVPSNL